MNDIEIFKNQEFGEVRTILIDDEPWFVGKDVASALGYSNTNDALLRHVDEEDKQTSGFTMGGQIYNMTIINESGLYSLTLSSKLATAKKFKRWITKEVIPSIRKHGGYLTPQKMEEFLSDPDTIIKLAMNLKEERMKRKEAERINEENRPKVEFFDTVAESKTATSMNDVAKALNFSNVGRNKLFQILRDNKILMQDNRPYQTYIDRGYFRVIEQHYQGKDGMPQISFKTLVYQKGVDFIRRKLLEIGYKQIEERKAV